MFKLLMTLLATTALAEFGNLDVPIDAPVVRRATGDIPTACYTHYSMLGGNGEGNEVRWAANMTGPECCALCYETKGCVASMLYAPDNCAYLLHVSHIDGEISNEFCPSGVNSYNLVVSSGSGYRGPCAA